MLQNLVTGVGLHGDVMKLGHSIAIIRGALNLCFVYG
jgi:hypothetical protein